MQFEDLTKRWGVLFVRKCYIPGTGNFNLKVELMFADSRKKARELKVRNAYVSDVALVFDTWGWEWFIDTTRKAQKIAKRKHNAI